MKYNLLNPEPLLQFYKSLASLLLGVIPILLFFMWLPDFIAWYLRKVAGIELTFIFEVIPLVVVISAVSCIGLFTTSTACLSSKPKKGETT